MLYLLVGLLVLYLFPIDFRTELEQLFAVGICVLWLALITGIEIVALGLNRRKFWAWIAGLCIFGMYVPSLFLPLGALGLWALLDHGSRAEFGMGDSGSSANASPAGCPPFGSCRNLHHK